MSANRYTDADIYAAASALAPFMRARQIVMANPEDLDAMAFAVLEAYFGELSYSTYPSRVLRDDEAVRDVELARLWAEQERANLQGTGWRATLRTVIRRLYSRFLSSSLLS